MQTRTKESKKRLHSLILLLAFTAVLLIVSTYAWFTAQTDVNISNIRGIVEVAEGLEISLDGGTWAQSIDLGDTEKVSLTTPAGTDGIVFGPYSADDNDVPSQFLPVSTSGETETPADSDEGIMKMYSGSYSGTTLSDIVQETEGEDNGYYAFDLYLKDTSKEGNATGDTTKNVLQLNSDSWAWVLPDNDPIGNFKGDYKPGIQNAVRIAFLQYGHKTADPIPAQADRTYVQEQVDETNQVAVSIWEPNSATHTPYTVLTMPNLFNLAMGTSPVTAETDNAFTTKTLNSGAITKGSFDVYNWKDENTYLTATKTNQTTYTGTPGTTGFAPYITGVKSLKTIATTDTEFTFPVNAITKYRVYIWVEGQDPDCHNTASLGGGIEVNIGLVKGETEGTKTKQDTVKAATGNPASFVDGLTKEGKDAAASGNS